jgi:hypothetical protein
VERARAGDTAHSICGREYSFRAQRPCRSAMRLAVPWRNGPATGYTCAANPGRTMRAVTPCGTLWTLRRCLERAPAHDHKVVEVKPVCLFGEQVRSSLLPRHHSATVGIETHDQAVLPSPWPRVVSLERWRPALFAQYGAITPFSALTGWFCSHQHLGDRCAEDLVQRSDPLNTKSKGRAESSAASRA